MSTRLRLTPEARREQLLLLGTRLLGTRPLDEFSVEVVAEEAGISRGLLYHYFGSKHGFVLAVLQRMTDDLFETTAPVDHPDLSHRLEVSLRRYLDWVRENLTGYRSLLREARSGNAEVLAIYESGRNALTDRIFESSTPEDLASYGIVDTPKVRLFARSWAAMVEDVILSWLDDPRDLTAEEVVGSLTFSLGGVLAAVSATD